VQVPGGRRGDYDLGELLTTARGLRERHDVPVILALGWSIDGPDVQREYYRTFFDQKFTMSEAARADLRAEAQLLGSLQSATFTDENYDVYVLW
jgi:hypothetical protein